MNHRTIFCALGLLSLGLLPAAEQAAGRDVVELDLENFDIIPPRERWQFSPPPERRDIFFDLEKRLLAELKINQLRAERDAEAIADELGEDIKRAPITSKQDAIDRAEAIFADVQQDMANERWNEALKRSTNGIKILTAILKKQGHDEAIAKIIDKLARLQVLAEEAKLLAEAKEEFAKLALEVEGILWSADERSLAIISGETYAEQDRVKNILIVNIDVNRVDFMFTYKSRRFEFQRYIGD
jgi:hypothetical protein